MDIRQRLASNLRRLRSEQGWSKEDYADRAGIHRTYVSSLERCQYSATIDMVETLARILDVEATDLLKARSATKE